MLMAKVALVVDDSMLIRYALCRFLEGRGFTVESATDGTEALEIVARVLPDVIVTDMQMRKMSGGELITALKAKPETARLPIIVVSSKRADDPGFEKRSDFTICKDIDIEGQLGRALDALAGKAGREQAAGK